MEKLCIREILCATRGELLCGNENEEVISVSTNSREATRGCLFVPICGEKMDGHKFIENAFENGAVATFTSEHDAMDSDKVYIKVKNTLDAMQDLAAYYRGKFGMPVVGITGSSGKTSTKEMISTVLSQKFNTVKTEGNLNGQIGLPQAVFKMDSNHDVAVIEMGMSKFGEMERLSHVARPTFAVMTNIGVTHIENLKTRENILKEKLHIVDTLGAGSVLFVNGDDDYLKDLKLDKPFEIVTFGIKNDSDFMAENIEIQRENTCFDVNFNGKKEKMSIPVIGIHNVYNALVATALGLKFGVSINEIKEGLLRYENLNMRQQVCRLEGYTLIDDTYNASPDSMESALNVLKEVSGKGRKIAVLADMLELGEMSKRLHFELGEKVAKSGVNVLLTVGKEARNIAEGARSCGENMVVEIFDLNDDAIDYLNKILKNGDTILVKGSRGMHMEQIAQFFKK